MEAFCTLAVSHLLCEIRSKCVGSGNEEGEEGLVRRKKAGEPPRSVNLGNVTGLPGGLTQSVLTGSLP